MGQLPAGGRGCKRQSISVQSKCRGGDQLDVVGPERDRCTPRAKTGPQRRQCLEAETLQTRLSAADGVFNLGNRGIRGRDASICGPAA